MLSSCAACAPFFNMDPVLDRQGSFDDDVAKLQKVLDSLADKVSVEAEPFNEKKLKNFKLKNGIPAMMERNKADETPVSTPKKRAVTEVETPRSS